MLFSRFVRLAQSPRLLTLSVIIVNYNVKYFLEHCLYSVEKALGGMEAEVIVIDNNSTDGSLDFLQCRFQWVKFIAAGRNLGFARACNEGLRHSSGAYVLFLNPDTIVAEESFKKSIDFFEHNSDCGALGVRMIDGAGHFLKESKRAFPSPLTSFYKLIGLGRIFPRSRVFGRYHLGHLDAGAIHRVDVLAGAYLMVRRSVLDEVGSFDEKFFMYGEDVDLSYRIQQAGYGNYYFPGTTIIHFKGESTRRGSLNYVRMFYNAMSIFVKKHYGGTKAGIFNASIQVAIWLRALVAGLAKLIGRTGLGVFDAFLILLSFFLVKEVWTRFFKTDLVFPDRLLMFSIPLFTGVYLATAYYAGLYDRFYKSRTIVRASSIAIAAVLIVYGLLPEDLRFSRVVVFAGALLATFFIWMQRWFLHQAGWLPKAAGDRPKPYILVAATPEEYGETVGFLRQAGLENKVIGRVSVNGNGGDFVTTLPVLDQSAQMLDAREMIFCAGKLSYAEIIQHVQNINGNLTVRFHAFGAKSIVGSDASDASGHTLAVDSEFNLDKPSNRRLKRMLDVLVALLLLGTAPLQWIGGGKFSGRMANAWKVLTARRTWVGYLQPGERLPRLRPGVLTHNGPRKVDVSLPQGSLQQMDYWYARNYDPVLDLKTIIRNYRWLGQ